MQDKETQPSSHGMITPPTASEKSELAATSTPAPMAVDSRGDFKELAQDHTADTSETKEDRKTEPAPGVAVSIVDPTPTKAPPPPSMRPTLEEVALVHELPPPTMSSPPETTARATTVRGFKCDQAFFTTANEDNQDGDRVTALEFSKCGNHIALGDHGGRVWIYSTPEGRARVQPGSYMEKRRTKEDDGPRDIPSFEFYGQFQSHEPEFDYLKSLEIEEKINAIKWCHQTNNSLTLLATNDKTIKLWKIFEKRMQRPGHTIVDSLEKAPSGLGTVSMPPLDCYDTITAAIPRKVFANGHAYHINSIDVNCDGETFMSVDDLRINIWSLEKATSNYIIQDIKPANMEDLSEVITSAIYHPHHCNILAYSTSKGFVYLADLRSNATVQTCTKTFVGQREGLEKSFFSEIVASMADQDFSHCGNYVVARDFLTLKVWDVRKSAAPINEVAVHPEIEDRMCDLYECDCIFDKFQCSCSSQSSTVISGTYGNAFVCWNWVTNEIERYFPKPKKANATGSIDFRNEKILHTAWDPTDENMAVSTFTGMHIYCKGQKGKPSKAY